MWLKFLQAQGIARRFASSATRTHVADGFRPMALVMVVFS